MNAYSAHLAYLNKKTGLHQTRPIQWQTVGLWLLALACGGITRSILPTAKLELSYQLPKLASMVMEQFQHEKQLPASAPLAFNPLVDDQGNIIEPVDTEFSLIIPKVGINAPIISAVDPTDTNAYHEALTKGVAHASTSFFPDENGLVYLFSHSTNYEWFVKDLNAVFYLLKNLEEGDLIVVVYKGVRYTYTLTEKRIVSPSEVSYIAPMEGKKMLILQTCWPPGSTTERLLVFADLLKVQE